MSSRLATFRHLARDFGEALKDFQSSGTKFRVLKTINPTSKTATAAIQDEQAAKTKTLLILDSSFNPPSIAHQSLALTALRKSECARFTQPCRLLLLFATMNADKAPAAASFDQRLALMTLFAEDVLASLTSDPGEYLVVPIDVGVTTVPYYTDKSAAIESDGSQYYASNPTHVHLLGYDTFARFFATKYYKEFDPPLSALEPYFDRGHQLRVTLRPGDEFSSLDDQKGFLRKLEDGGLEKDGGQKHWAKQITMVPPNDKTGVSSTKIRKAVAQGQGDIISQLCTPTIAEWLTNEQMYNDKG